MESPAFMVPSTGEIHVNKKVFHRLTQDEQRMVLAHEVGHLVHGHQQPSQLAEIEADAFASNAILYAGGSPKKSVFALLNMLDTKRPEHLQRAELQLYRAQKFSNNKQPKVNTMNGYIHPDLIDRVGEFNESLDNELMSFFGKNAKANRNAKKAAKVERIQSKNAVRFARADSKQTNALARQTLAEQGISGGGGGGGDFMGKLKGFGEKAAQLIPGLGPLLGGGGGGVNGPSTEEDNGSPSNTPNPNTNTNTSTSDKDKDKDKDEEDDKIMGMSKGAFAAVAAVVVVVIIVVLVVVMKKK